MTRALLSLLQEEERALSAGDVRAVLALQQNKAALLSQVREDEGASAEQLAEIRTVAIRNERLLQLALTACKQANERISAIEGQIRRVGYGANGEGVSYAEDRSKRRL